MDCVDKYLNPKFCNFNTDEMNDFGLFKLWIIRTISIYYRHILQYWLYKNPDVLTEYNYDSLLFTKKNKNIYKIILELYMRAHERLHKIERNVNNIKINVFFDFDNTLTSIVKRNVNFDYINDAIIYTIFGNKMCDSMEVVGFKPKIIYHILTANGSKDTILDFVKKYNIDKMFKDRIYACAGNREKVVKMKNICYNDNKSICIHIDDDIHMCRLASLCFMLPILYIKRNGHFKFLNENL